MTFLPTDSLGNITTLDNSFTLSTGSYDRAASSLGLFTTGNREFLKPLGTEGSAATISNLNTGIYSFDWSMYSKDKNGWDKLYAWNGKELSLIGDRSSGNQISSACVFRVSGSGRGAFAARSARFVRRLSAAGGVLFSFPGRACPAGLVPSPSAAGCWCGLRSGSWASLAFAVGLGVPCCVWLPASLSVPASWGLVSVGGGWWVSLPF